MTYVATHACIKCEYTDEVHPVDYFYERRNMLAIHPDECIECFVYETECITAAIKSDSGAGLEQWRAINAEFVRKWTNTLTLGAPRRDAAAWDSVRNKYPEHFNDRPGSSHNESKPRAA